MKLTTCLFVSGLLLFTATERTASAQEAEVAKPELELVYQDSFDEDQGKWKFLDPESWKYLPEGVLSQFVKKATYAPPHRSPFHVALLADQVVTDFDLTATVRSTVKDYGHRDACVVFGYVDDAHFYYVHLGLKTDPHSNQIFIVNGADRKAISLTTTKGTKWTDEWHHLKVSRRVESGSIEIYYDDLEKPVMTAKDTTFAEGGVGIGCFDDTTDWDEFELRGNVPAKQ